MDWDQHFVANNMGRKIFVDSKHKLRCLYRQETFLLPNVYLTLLDQNNSILIIDVIYLAKTLILGGVTFFVGSSN